MHAISISHLTKVYKVRKGMQKASDKLALHDLSLNVDRGEVFGFLGPNGAGKSTLIKILLDIIRPSSGTAKLMGNKCSKALARKKVGYLPEHPTFCDYLTAEEYLFFVGRVYGMRHKVLAARIDDILDRLGLWDVRKKPLRIYSKGMVQRLGIAQVLVHDPDIYILDEPMSGLDPLGRALIKEIILELKGIGKCVFLSSHIIADIEQICDRTGIIANGKLLSVEKVANVMEKGIRGYSIHLSLPDGLSRQEYVAKNKLIKFFEDIAGTQTEIRLIEPVRKDLEQYFLDLVNQAPGQ